MTSYFHTASVIPNTHRRRWRDSTVCIEFATSSRRLPTKIWKLNMLRIYPVELSCVGGVYTPVRCRDPVYNSAAYMWLAQKIGNWVTTDDWCVHTADATVELRRRRRCVLGLQFTGHTAAVQASSAHFAYTLLRSTRFHRPTWPDTVSRRSRDPRSWRKAEVANRGSNIWPPWDRTRLRETRERHLAILVSAVTTVIP